MPLSERLKQVGTRIPIPLDRVTAFSRKWGLKEFALFGSVLRDDFRPDSDVDVLVTFDASARPSLFDLGEMQQELEEFFGRPVDLIERSAVEQGLNWYRRRAILNSAEVVYAA